MNQAKLDRLEEKLQDPEDWDQAMNYFFDHFGTEPEFLEMSQKTRLITFVYLMNIHKGVFSIANLQTMKVEHCSRVSALPLGSVEDEDHMYSEPWNINLN